VTVHACAHDDARSIEAREEIRAHEGGRGKRYDAVLKQRVIGFACNRRERGHTWKAISTELGMCFETLVAGASMRGLRGNRFVR
jgi:hypothetical protein